MRNTGLDDNSIIFCYILLDCCSYESSLLLCVCRELAMILSLAQSNPVMFSMVAEQPDVAKQLERMGRLKELMETNENELKEKQHEDWSRWVKRYKSVQVSRDIHMRGGFITRISKELCCLLLQNAFDPRGRWHSRNVLH